MDAKGSFELEDGSRFSGRFAAVPITGIGTLYLPNGDVYDGEFVAGYYSGIGELRLKCGILYKGTFENGRLHGEGEFRDGQGRVYVGLFKQGRFHGQGELMQDLIYVYKGEWADGEYSGRGEINQGNYCFSGQFKHGRKCGFGIEKTDRWEYVGEYQANKYHGQGILRRETYSAQGTFEKGDLVQGIIMYHNGDNIELKYDKNLKIVKARMIRPSGDVKIGVWNDNEILEIGEEIREMIWRYREKLQRAQRENPLIAVLRSKYEHLYTLLYKANSDNLYRIAQYYEWLSEVYHYDVHFEYYVRQAQLVLTEYNALLLADSERKNVYGAAWSSSAFRMFIGKRCEEIYAFISVLKAHCAKLAVIRVFNIERLKDLFSYLHIKLQYRTRNVSEVISRSSLQFLQMTVFQIFFALDSIDINLPEITTSEIYYLMQYIDGIVADIAKGNFGYTLEQQMELQKALEYAYGMKTMREFNLSAQDKIEQFGDGAHHLQDVYECEVQDKAKDAAKGRKIKIVCGLL